MRNWKNFDIVCDDNFSENCEKLKNKLKNKKGELQNEI